jgi:hypothetical protein
MAKTTIYATQYGTFAIEREGRFDRFDRFLESPLRYTTYHLTLEDAKAELNALRTFTGDEDNGEVL